MSEPSDQPSPITGVLRRIPFSLFLLPGILTLFVGFYICQAPYFTLAKHHRELSWLSISQNGLTYLGGIVVSSFGVAHCMVWWEIRKMRNKSLGGLEAGEVRNEKVGEKSKADVPRDA